MACPWHMYQSTHVSTMLMSSRCDALTSSLVSISAAIIAPSLIIAFNLQNIEDFLNKRKNVRQVGPAPSGAGPSGITPGVGEIPLGALEAEGKRKQKLPDEEQGRKSANSSF
jgi:hypothetical protein